MALLPKFVFHLDGVSLEKIFQTDFLLGNHLVLIVAKTYNCIGAFAEPYLLVESLPNVQHGVLLAQVCPYFDMLGLNFAVDVLSFEGQNDFNLGYIEDCAFFAL